jgi:Spy/CpxP family protein refolding chaperone
MMNFKIIDGVFSRQEAIDILTDMVRLKIRFHERRIETSSHIEDISHREARIRELQSELQEARERILAGDMNVSMGGSVSIGS